MDLGAGGQNGGIHMKNLQTQWAQNKMQLLFCLVSTYLWGLAAHAYRFFGNYVSHDSLYEFHGAIAGNDIKLSSGRVFVPLYRDLLRSDITLPWLIGILSLLWIGLAVFLVVRLFKVERKGIVFLTAGIFAVNVSVSSTAATYLQDLDCNMFSVLLAVGAVWLWRNWKWGWLAGGVLLAGTLGIYQAYIFVAVTLVMLLSILDLLNGEKFSPVFSRGLLAVAMVLLGGLLYYIAMQVILAYSHVSLTKGDYNSLDQILKLTPSEILTLSIQAYRDWLDRILNCYTTYPAMMVKGINLLLFAAAGGTLVYGLFRRPMGMRERVLCVVLIGLLPLGMNLIYVLIRSESHDLMVFPIWLFYLLVLLLADWLWKQWEHRGRLEKAGVFTRTLCMLLVGVLLYGHVQFSNGMYLKKDLEYDAYLSLMTRVVSRMEEREDYVPGQTPVVFAGRPENLNDIIPGFKEFVNVIGMLSSDVVYYAQPWRFQAYFDYVLGTPVLFAEYEKWLELQESDTVAAMPSYPAQGCMQMIDGTLVVKLG